MAGLYSRNHIFDKQYTHGMETLDVLEDEVCADEAVRISVWEDYETLLEDNWADFIREFYVD